MKKSIIAISAIIIVASIFFTSCGKELTAMDSSGKEHIIVTDKNGNTPQDQFGNIYEEITDKDGKKATQLYDYPVVSTNKSMSVLENAAIKLEVPKDWKASGDRSVFRLRHTGKCADLNIPQCELNAEIVRALTQQETYDEYKANVRGIAAANHDVTNIKEYKAKICGIEALAISYHIDSDNSTVLYYVIPNGYINVQFIVIVDDKCYNNDSVVELINSCVTLKDLGETSTTQATTTTTAETVAETTTAAATK